jgi:hypothetical protein
MVFVKTKAGGFHKPPYTRAEKDAMDLVINSPPIAIVRGSRQKAPDEQDPPLPELPPTESQ